MPVEPNVTPRGQSCNTCRFAATHTCAEDAATRVRIKCRRFPPKRLGNLHPGMTNTAELVQQQGDTAWPVLTVDDWCGEWAARAPANRKRRVDPNVRAK